MNKLGEILLVILGVFAIAMILRYPEADAVSDATTGAAGFRPANDKTGVPADALDPSSYLNYNYTNRNNTLQVPGAQATSGPFVASFDTLVENNPDLLGQYLGNTFTIH